MNTKVKRGRTGNDQVPAMKATPQGLVTGSREESAHKPDRPERISMSNMKKLDVPEGIKEEGFYYRWFQDRDGRLNQARSAYYEPVVDEQGNNYTRNSGPYTLHLMRLPQQYRDEDNLLKKKAVAATLDAEAQIGHGEYAPDSKTGRDEGGTSAITHHHSDNEYS